MHDTQVEYCKYLLKEKRTQVTTTFNGKWQHYSIQLQKEVKSNPKTAQL